MRPENFNVEELIDSLSGTCDTIDEHLPEGMYWEDVYWEDLTTEDHAQIDSQIFLCEQCGWWAEQSEAHENPDGGGDLCDDCHEETEEG